MEIKRASVIGLGKLGSPMAACFAAKGITTVGVDLNPAFVNAVNEGKPPVNEPRLEELIKKGRKNLTATQDTKKAVRDTEATFILVPTPSNETGGFSLDYVMQAAKLVAEVLKEKSEYHLVVVTSTVMPGSTGGPIKELLENVSGKRCGKDFGLCYNPEFIALGSVVRDFLNPDFILVGESDPKAGEILEKFYPVICDNHPPVRRMNWVNAELTKLSVNTYVTTKISFANFLGRICHELPGADVDVVTAAIGTDTRIGAKYLKGAVGYGGPCFPRDNLALTSLARGLGIQAGIAQATDQFNRAHVKWLAELVQTHLAHPKSKVSILGLAYKPGTEVVEEAQGIYLAKLLVEGGVSVIGYDPIANQTAAKVLPKDVEFSSSMASAVQASDIVVLTSHAEEFAKMDLNTLARPTKPRILIDCWRLFKGKNIPTGLLYFPLGIGMGSLSMRQEKRKAA